jgi:hypothetical protein
MFVLERRKKEEFPLEKSEPRLPGLVPITILLYLAADKPRISTALRIVLE